MNGAWEVKGDEHAVPVRGVVDQFVRWLLGGTFWPRTDENDWCRHIFREHNGDGQEAPYLHEKMHKSRRILCLSMGPEGRADWVAAAWILWLRDEYGSFEKVDVC